MPDPVPDPMPDPVQGAHQLLSAGQVEQAVALLEKGGSSGHAQALTELATWYLIGQAVPRDLLRARFFLRQAVAIGHADAALMEVALTANGSGGPAAWAVALDLLRRAAPADYIAAGQLKLVEAMALGPDGMPLSLPMIEPLSRHPEVGMARALLSEAECLHIAQSVQPALVPSVVADPRTGRNIEHPIRTSDSAVIGPTREDLVIGAINRRVAALTGTALEQGETLSVLRYSPGQQYRPHYDALPQTDNQRAYTVLLYLNDGYQGGETRFLHNGLNVQGRRGDALIFRNMRADGSPDPATQHAGLPVRSGVKWLATRWIRQHPFNVWAQRT